MLVPLKWLRGKGIKWEVLEYEEECVGYYPDAETSRVMGVRARTTPITRGIPTKIRITKGGEYEGRIVKKGEILHPRLHWIDKGMGDYDVVVPI